MKKNFFALAAAAVSLFAAVNQANAQKNTTAEKQWYEKNNNGAGRQLAPSHYETMNLAVIIPKAVKDFGRTYPYATAASWEKIRSGYAAKFIFNGITHRIYYDNNGKWEGSLKGYSEDKMPAEIRKVVKREYYDYTITYVNEAENIDSGGMPTYIVHLENQSSLKLMRIYDGVMEPFVELNKP